MKKIFLLLTFNCTVLTSFAQFNLAPRVDYATGNNPNSVSISDLTGDGKADIAVLNQNSNTMSIYTNTGIGNFVSKVDFATGASPDCISNVV